MSPAGEARDPSAAMVTPATAMRFTNPLPGDEATWDNCPLGPASEWPSTVQALVKTIYASAYPAAIFWGEESTLLCNKAWMDSSSNSAAQGQNQRGKLSEDVLQALRSSFEGGKPRALRSQQLMGGEPESPDAHIVLLSPLFASDNHDPVGVLAQLFPTTEGSTASNITSGAATIGDSPLQKSQSAPASTCEYCSANNDNLPLDEHPFFHRFSEMLPTGLAILNHEARAIFVNQRFYELTTHKDNDKSFTAWPQSIHPDDYERVMTAYREAFQSRTELRTEFRSLGEKHPWRLLLLTPLGDENLKHVSESTSSPQSPYKHIADESDKISLRENGGFLCSIVDISSEKSAELAEREAAKEAKERKEQQERFIDMISHEIRNPLSAILHCTEDIEGAIQLGASDVDVPAIREAVDTINLCISHQRNIVDDVLSFSKLDARMLSLAPKPYRPSQQIENSLKMFQPEVRKQHIQFNFTVDQSYADCDVTWTMADIPRIGQVLVNLVSNAIKFTVRKEGEKQIAVSVGASLERPTSWPHNVVFFNADDLAYRMDATNTSEWGNGEALYVMVAVRDTGIGINAENQKRLFERFRQATPKTEEMYGGSGLGLNISRKLCHLHGGEIGVASKEGAGSTFGFFFKTRRTDAPPEESGVSPREQVEVPGLKSAIERHGLASSEEKDDPTDLQSLKTSSAAHPMDQLKDGRLAKTTKVAAQVNEPEPDPYANAERPKISVVHRGGEQWQSQEISDAKAKKAKMPQQGEGETGSASSSSEAQPGMTREKAHVLLAEDNIVNQHIVFKKLEKAGFNVTTANNGQEAVEALRDAPARSSSHHEATAFDIVLMDQEMPVMDGNAATQEIRRLQRESVIDAHIPILGVTANVRKDQQTDMISSGMDDVISKPYKIDELVEKMEKLLRSTRSKTTITTTTTTIEKEKEKHRGEEEGTETKDNV